jgi:DNA-directed RNA polymerase subunit D
VQEEGRKERKKSLKMVELKLISKDKNRLTIYLNKTTPSYVNALRRIIVSELPTLAIEDVEFRKNSSVLYDEIIGHRLGLVPLTTDLKSYNFKDKCKCNGEGCARCTVKFTLSEKGPKTVYASELKSTDPDVKPVFPKTPIVTLLKDQELEIEATAMLGTGNMHSKWSPGHIHFKVKPEIKIDNSKISNPAAVAEACPQKIFEVKGSKLVVNEDNLVNCNLCHECTDIAKDAIQIIEEETSYIFYIESWGQLSPKEMLTQSIQIFDGKLEELSKSL